MSETGHIDPAEVGTRYRETVGFILKSASAFDDGDLPEAVRLATSVRTLLYDEGRGDSVLTQLGVKSEITEWRSFHFPPVWDDLPEDAATFGGSLFTFVVGGPGGGGINPTDNGPSGRSVTFEAWWRGEPVVQSGHGQIVRRQLVLGLANNDGGAHVDLAGTHLEALHAGSPTPLAADGTAFGGGERRVRVRELLHVQMRAIATEVMYTVDNAVSAGLENLSYR